MGKIRGAGQGRDGTGRAEEQGQRPRVKGGSMKKELGEAGAFSIAKHYNIKI